MNKKHQIQQRIKYLQSQLEDVGYNFPETCKYLTSEIDYLKRQLAEIDYQDYIKQQCL